MTAEDPTEKFLAKAPVGAFAQNSYSTYYRQKIFPINSHPKLRIFNPPQLFKNSKTNLGDEIQTIQGGISFRPLLQASDFCELCKLLEDLRIHAPTLGEFQKSDRMHAPRGPSQAHNLSRDKKALLVHGREPINRELKN